MTQFAGDDIIQNLGLELELDLSKGKVGWKKRSGQRKLIDKITELCVVGKRNERKERVGFNVIIRLSKSFNRIVDLK